MVLRLLLVLMMTFAAMAMTGCKKEEPDTVGGLIKKAEDTAEEAKEEAEEAAEDVDVEAEVDKIEKEIDEEM